MYYKLIVAWEFPLEWCTYFLANPWSLDCVFRVYHVKTQVINNLFLLPTCSLLLWQWFLALEQTNAKRWLEAVAIAAVHSCVHSCCRYLFLFLRRTCFVERCHNIALQVCLRLRYIGWDFWVHQWVVQWGLEKWNCGILVWGLFSILMSSVKVQKTVQRFIFLSFLIQNWSTFLQVQPSLQVGSGNLLQNLSSIIDVSRNGRRNVLRSGAQMLTNLVINC